MELCLSCSPMYWHRRILPPWGVSPGISNQCNYTSAHCGTFHCYQSTSYYLYLVEIYRTGQPNRLKWVLVLVYDLLVSCTSHAV